MEQEPHINSDLSIGRLHCEAEENIDIVPSGTRIHLFHDGSFPCIEVLDYEAQEEKIYRIPTPGILNAVAEHGVSVHMHQNDLAFREKDVLIINTEEIKPLEWAFTPAGTQQGSFRPEAIVIYPEDKELLDQELEPFSYAVLVGREKVQLTPKNTVGVNVTDKPILSHIVVLSKDGKNECFPADEMMLSSLREQEFTYLNLESSAIPDYVQKDLIHKSIQLSDDDLETLL